MSAFGTLVVLTEVPAHDNQPGTRTAIAQREDGACPVLSHLAPDTVLVLGPGTTEHFTQQVLSRLRRLPRETASVPIPEGHLGSAGEHASVTMNDVYRGELVSRLLTGQTILLIASQPRAQALLELLDDNDDTLLAAPAAPESCIEFTFDRYLTPIRRRSLSIRGRLWTRSRESS